MKRKTTVSSALLAASVVFSAAVLSQRIGVVEAYHVVPHRQQQNGRTRTMAATRMTASFASLSLRSPASPTTLRMVSEDENGGEEERTAVDEKRAEAAAGSEEGETAEAEEEGEEEPEEDPEVAALKEEIEEYERKLKQTRRQVMDVSDRAEEYTQSGYGRKVAEMENMRRARSVSRLCLLCVCCASTARQRQCVAR